MCALALSTLAGCGSRDSDGATATNEDIYEAELFPSTRVLDEATLQSLKADDADGTLHFTGTPAALTGLQQFDVVAAGVSSSTPNGMLRLVLAIENDANGLVLRTTHAPLPLAFRKLHVRLERSVEDIAAVAPSFTEPVSRVQATGGKTQKKPVSIAPFNGDGDLSTTDDQAVFTGNLGGGLHYLFDIHVDWGAVENVPETVKDCLKNAITFGGCSLVELIPEATVDYFVDGTLEAELHGQGVSFLPYGEDYELGPEIELPKIPIGILVFWPALQVRARIEGEASSQFELSMAASAGVAAGGTFSNKSGANIKKPTGTWNFSAPVVDATLRAKTRVSVGPDLHLRLYNAAGPYAGVKAFAELGADQSKTPCYELRGGVEGNLGFDIRIDLPFFDPFTLVRTPPMKFELVNEIIDSGSCKPLPGGPATGTGGDPSASAFSSPQFTPWSRSYSGIVDTFPYGSFGAIVAASDINPTIDGRFVVTGSGMKAITKLDRLGNIVWSKSYSRAERLRDTQGFDLLPTATVNTGDAGLFAIAHPFSLLKVEANGDLIWAKELGGEYNEDVIRLTAVTSDGAGSLYVAGNYGEDALNKRAVDTWLIRFDEESHPAWSKRIGSAADGEMVRVVLPYQGGTVVAGQLWDAAESNFRAWVARFDGSGALVWARRFDTRACGSQYLSSAYVTTGLVSRDGDLVFGGEIDIGDSFIFKLKPDGTLAWSASETDMLAVDLGWEVTSLVELPTSGYLAAGHWSEHNQGDNHNDLWLAALDGVGRIQWLRRYGAGSASGEDDVYPTLQLTDDGGVLVAGFSVPLGSDSKGLWMFKPFAKDGQIAFNAASGMRNDAPGFQPSSACVQIEAWTPAVVDHPAEPKPLEVTVKSLSPTTQTQAP